MSNAITIRVEGLGPVPSFKNNKMMARGKLFTDPVKQKWMERCVQGLVWSLYSRIPTDAAGTSTEPHQLSLIALCVPEDDCWECIPELHIKAVRCAKGLEGATIIIERLT